MYFVITAVIIAFIIGAIVGWKDNYYPCFWDVFGNGLLVGVFTFLITAFLSMFIGIVIAGSNLNAYTSRVIESYDLKPYYEEVYVVREKGVYGTDPYYIYKVDNGEYIETRKCLDSQCNFYETKDTPRVEIIQPYFKNDIVRFFIINTTSKQTIFYIPENAIEYEKSIE